MNEQTNIGARLVGVVHAFDVDQLAGWMRKHVPGFDGNAKNLTIEQFQGGQSNPTYRIMVDDGSAFILRRKPPGKLLPSAHAVDREYRIMAALAKTDVPVPKMYGLCEDPTVIGTPFYLMEYVRGRIYWNPTLPEIDHDSRHAYYMEMNRVIAALHMVDYKAAGLDDFGRPGQFIERQIGRWSKQYHAGCEGDAAAPRIAAMDQLIEWLSARVPTNDETTLTHGDFRLDNLIWHPTEARVLAVLDWELSTLGHPLSDFAYLLMGRHLPAEIRGMAGADTDTLGIPSEAETIADYCQRTGRTNLPDFDYYVIFNIFRIAAILHGVWARALQGNASDKNALAMGQLSEGLAKIAWEKSQSLQNGVQDGI